MKKEKIFCITILLLTILSLIFIMAITIFVDPYFHYNKPNPKMIYIVNDERYQNNGITKNFNYTTIITGTSMTQNFKTSECDFLFKTHSIKVPYAGASFKEINDSINNALKYNNKINIVIRCLDYTNFYKNKDELSYEEDTYPKYLNNDIIIDDIKYLLNKDVFMKYTLPALKSYSSDNHFTVDFDAYSNWNDQYEFGKSAILSSYTRAEKIDYTLSTTEIDEMKDNIEANIISTIRDNPNVDFYYFIPPYSMYWWDEVSQKNEFDKYRIAEEILITNLLKYDNAYLFSFNNNFELITNLNNYKDAIHYSEEINSYILEMMSQKKYLLTKDNYKQYLDDTYNFYVNYDYESLYN